MVMLRSLTLKMLSQTLLVSICSLISGTFAQVPTYVVLDNYTVQNFFNMFTFYTVSGTVVAALTSEIFNNDRATIPLMVMSNMLTDPLLSRTDTLLQTQQISTSAPII